MLESTPTLDRPHRRRGHETLAATKRIFAWGPLSSRCRLLLPCRGLPALGLVDPLVVANLLFWGSAPQLRLRRHLELRREAPRRRRHEHLHSPQPAPALTGLPGPRA
ncbi:MAG: hypothetical protein ACLTDR_04695 [Adlercreutzia equolifaciens]